MIAGVGLETVVWGSGTGASDWVSGAAGLGTDAWDLESGALGWENGALDWGTSVSGWVIAALDLGNGAWGSGSDVLDLVNDVWGFGNAWASACGDLVIADAASSTSYAGFADELGVAMETSAGRRASGSPQAAYGAFGPMGSVNGAALG